ncbi:hypothetical protein BD289DRAFT_486214 [Coniella lustricola]|uniref:Shugoshin n=1 Tax=Coniella lustricola TaxID=2025994 RepID=A0A2T2ZVV9_9PEZI|nr:hypothetical protein BD289DRAFT_486214 [Coniella lustricola]
MARLNEPPMSLDNIETLRRKFLRQNREIARANSVQSQRIRSLESECGRLLSENLSQSSRILELEKELEQSRSAQRIADHALEIKEKMEAQLVEWGAMLQGLGVEPAAKRHATMSPGGTRIARQRKHSDRSPAAKRRPRDSRTAEEIASLEEGRLPPILENPTYPRRTMSHAELLSLCDEAEEHDSPDLGPPPTSRFVEEDPIKIDSPSRSTGALQASPKIRNETLAPPETLQQPKLDPKKKPILPSDAPAAASLEPTKPATVPTRPPLVKAGSKRKFGEENYDAQPSKAVADNAKVAGKATTNNAPAFEVSTDPIKPPTKETDKSTRVGAKAARPRKPLADKTVNSDLMSPKRIVKSASTDDLKKTTLAPGRTVAPLKKKRLVPIKLAMPQMPPPPSTIISNEPSTPSTEAEIILPDTPESKNTETKAHDTPPPADISSRGETSRPSRRARQSISYAEPNLRDKMRRPTKELFDAVAGEGKYVRHSAAHPLVALSSASASSSASRTKSEDNHLTKDAGRDAESAMASEAARRPLLDSPLIEKEASKEQARASLAESGVTNRRRRPSGRHSQLIDQMLEEDDISEDKQQLQQESRAAADPYEFNSTSPPTFAQPPEPAATTTRGRTTKGMRRSMAASSGPVGDETMADESSSSNNNNNNNSSSSRPARKRASLASVTKKSLMLDAPLDDESSSEHGGDPVKGGESSLTGKERVSRRRSMML